jgi:amino acid permease
MTGRRFGWCCGDVRGECHGHVATFTFERYDSTAAGFVGQDSGCTLHYRYSHLYLYPANHRGDETAFQQHWLDVRPSLVKSLGTIVFTFVSQHVVHLTYDSLKPEIRTISNWKIVSTLSVILSTLLSLAIAVSIYVTFWDQASSNIFELYPPSTPLDVAKLLLSFMMMCTYPSPFFACRELIILSLVTIYVEEENNQWWLLEPKQLTLPLHVFVTLVIWSTSTVLALLAPSLGDVLNLVGCASGTMIAFILPAMFSFFA